MNALVNTNFENFSDIIGWCRDFYYFYSFKYSVCKLYGIGDLV